MDTKIPITKTVEPSNTPSVTRHRNRGPNVSTRVAKLLDRLTRGEIGRYQQARLFRFPFSVDEQWLKKVNDSVESWLAGLEADTTEFSSETRFEDLSSVRHDSFLSFLAKAGDEKDPERTAIKWAKFAITEEGGIQAGEVLLTLATEKRLKVEDAVPGEIHTAGIELRVSGSDQVQVDRMYREIERYIETARLSGVYRPLWIFRNPWFIQIFTHVVGWMGFFLGIHFTGSLFDQRFVLQKADALKEILGTQGLSAKFDVYARYVLSPSNEIWWEPILRMAAGAITYAICYFAGLGLLPKLTPNSSIGVGLSQRRIASYENTFKFIVFTILVSGILIPLFLELIKYVFK